MKSGSFSYVVDFLDGLYCDIDTFRDDGDGRFEIWGGYDGRDYKWSLRFRLTSGDMELVVTPGYIINKDEIEFFSRCYQNIENIIKIYYGVFVCIQE